MEDALVYPDPDCLVRHVQRNLVGPRKKRILVFGVEKRWDFLLWNATLLFWRLTLLSF